MSPRWGLLCHQNSLLPLGLWSCWCGGDGAVQVRALAGRGRWPHQKASRPTYPPPSTPTHPAHPATAASRDVQITLAKCDATDKANEKIKTQFKIQGFPTMKARAAEVWVGGVGGGTMK